MNLKGGLFTECEKPQQPLGTWRDARNVVFHKGILRTERGVAELINYGTKTPIGEVVLPDDSYIIILVDTDNTNQIVHIKDNISTVCTNFNFGFILKYPIRGESRATYDGNFEVVLTDNNTPPRIITIDSTTSLIKESNINLTKLFPEIAVPNFNLLEVAGGGDLAKGGYQITVAYEFIDEGLTNWIGLSNPIIIKESGGAFTIEITDIDTKFSYFRVGLVKSNQGVITAQLLPNKYRVTGVSKIINVSVEGSSIDIETIGTKRLSYNTINDFSVLDGALYASDLVKETKIDYQQYANNINIEPFYSDTVSLEGDEDSYKDGVVIFDKKGFADDEIYAFYIHWLGKDGTSMGAFHIPCTGTNGMLISTNLGEEYPTGLGYPTGNVKHHKFPRKPVTDIINSYTISTISTQVSGITTTEITAGEEYYIGYTDTDSSNIGSIVNGTTPAAISKNEWLSDFNGKVDIEVGLPITCNGSNLNMKLDIYSVTSTGTTSLIHTEEGDPNTISRLSIHRTEINISIGWKIRVVTRLTGTGISGITARADYFKIHKQVPSTSQKRTKPTGIKVTNVVLPADIAEKVQGFEIMYAKRNATNSSIIGQSILWSRELSGVLSEQGVLNFDQFTSARFHDFGFLLKKPSLKIQKVKTQYAAKEKLTQNNDTIKHDFTVSTIIDDDYESNVTSSKYIPANNAAASNDLGEEFIELELETAYSTQIVPYADPYIAVVNALQPKDNYYISLDTQILISTGKVIKTPTAGTYQITKLFGGDVFTSEYRVRMHKEAPTNTSSKVHLMIFVVTSKFNIGLRNEGDLWYEKAGQIVVPKSIKNELNLSDNDAVEYSKEFSNYISYEDGFSLENTIYQPVIQGENRYQFPYRIIRSNPENKESTVSSWRQFLVANYYDTNTDRGRIINIETFDTDKLLIHHERGLFITAGKEIIATNITELIIGSGDVFERNPKEPIFTKTGILGTNHKFANFTCELGYVFISNGGLFVYTGKNIQEITAIGNKTLFEGILKDVGDNPYLQDEEHIDWQGGISLAFDVDYERLFVSIHNKPSSIVYSFSKTLNGWICTHDFEKAKFFNTYNKLYSFYSNSIYIHNALNVGKYYDLSTKECYVNVVLPSPEDTRFLIESVEWETICNDKNETFTSIRCSNSYQDTSKYDLTKFTNFSTPYDIRRSLNVWRFNKIRDQLQESVDFTKKAKLLDNFIEIILYYNNISGSEIAIKDVELYFNIIESV